MAGQVTSMLVIARQLLVIPSQQTLKPGRTTDEADRQAARVGLTRLAPKPKSLAGYNKTLGGMLR